LKKGFFLFLATFNMKSTSREIINMAEKKQAKKVYHLVKRSSDNKWAVKLQGGEKVIKLFNTKVEAEAFCEQMAENQGGTLQVHASKGASKGRIQ